MRYFCSIRNVRFDAIAIPGRRILGDLFNFCLEVEFSEYEVFVLHQNTEYSNSTSAKNPNY